jgi:hypothetical protein
MQPALGVKSCSPELVTPWNPAPSARDLDDRLQIHADPSLLTAVANGDLDLTERRFDGDRPVTTCDAGGPTSDEATTSDPDSLAVTGSAVRRTNDHGECAL